MTQPPLSLKAALAPVAVMIVLLAGAAFGLKSVDAEVLIVVMLISATTAGAIAAARGRTWGDIQRITGEKLASVLPAVLILLAIGMSIGSWVFSGTIPLMVHFGLRVVSPQYMILTAFLSTCCMSLCTGTSWGSAGTVGVALMGMAAAIDAPLAAVAGAIVSGAYFGDKLSPLSDSTNICAIGAGADLYAHVRNMLYTAGPSFVVAGAAYFIVGMKAGGAAGATPESAERLIADIETLYNLNPMILLPLIIVIAGIAMKKPAALTIALSTVVALAIGVALQGFQFADAARAAVSGFSIEMASARGFDPAAFGDDLQRLVNRGGLYMMSDTLIVIIAAFLLAAGLEAAGAMETLLNALLGQSRSVFRLVGASMGAGALTIGLTSHGGVTAMVVGGLFQKPYRDRGLAPENLSRSLEDSVTIVEPLLPWTVSAIYMASTLGVSTVAYAPWAIFCFSGPVFSLLLAATFERTGFGLKRLVAANRH